MSQKFHLETFESSLNKLGQKFLLFSEKLMKLLVHLTVCALITWQLVSTKGFSRGGMKSGGKSRSSSSSGNSHISSPSSSHTADISSSHDSLSDSSQLSNSEASQIKTHPLYRKPIMNQNSGSSQPQNWTDSNSDYQ